MRAFDGLTNNQPDRMEIAFCQYIGTLIASVTNKWVGLLVTEPMEYTDPTFAWKQLYWSAIEEGFEPWEAADHANRQLPFEMRSRETGFGDQKAQAVR